MADTLADSLNRAAGGAVSPAPVDAPVQPVQPNTAGWWNRFKDYVGNTDMAALSEGLMRLNPGTAPFFWGKDVQQGGIGKMIENNRLIGGQLSRFPTDVASSVVGLYPGVSSILEASGARDTPLPGAETLGAAADAIDEFGRKNWAEPIAGRSLEGEDAGTLLRGTGPEMAGNWARLMSQAIAPVPTKIAAPIMAGANLIKEGMGVLGPAAAMAGKTLEVLTPLAVSSSPSLKTAVSNLAVQGVLGPFTEAGIKALMPGEEAKAQQDQAQELMKQGTAQATAGKELATGPTVKVTPQLAGLTTGDTDAGIAITTGIALAGLFGYHKWDAIKRMGQGVTRAVTGYEPGKVEDASLQSLTTKLNQQIRDGSTSVWDTMEQTLKAAGHNQKNIDDMVLRAREEHASRSGAATGTRERVFYTTGDFMDTPVKSVPMNDVVVKHQALEAPQQQSVSQILWARQELDLRQRQMEKGFHRGTGPLGSTGIGNWASDAAMLRAQPPPTAPSAGAIFKRKYAVNLEDYTNRQLMDIINSGMRDAQVADVVHGYRDIVRKAADYMEINKRFTPAQVSKFRRENPNFVPPKLGVGQSHLDPRDPVNNLNPRAGIDIPRGLKTFEELGNPMETLPRYMDEVFRGVEGMKGKRDYMQMMIDEKARGNPIARQILGKDLSGDPTPESAHKYTTWRDLDGNKRVTEINDAVVRDALSGMTSPSTLQLQHGFWGKAGRLYESGAVGPLSLLSGTVFAPKSAIYTTTLGTVTKRPPGVAMGWIDKASQSLGGPEIRGDAITLTLDAFLRQAPLNLGALLVERGGTALHNSVLTDGILTKAFDKATLQNLADAARNWYSKTHMYEMQRNGLLAPGTFNAVDPAKMYTDPAASLRAAKNIFGSTGGLVNDILHAISAAPAMSIMTMNKNVDPVLVRSALRNMTGDPGASGAFRNANALAGTVNATPWGNIFIQSMAKMGETINAARKSPREAALLTTGIFNGVALPAALATYYNNSLGPEYSKYQYFEQTPDKAASSIYIGIPGRPPNEGINIDIDPVLRPFKYMMDALAGIHFGAFSNELHKPENIDQKEAFDAMMNHRYGSFDQGSVPRSLAQQTFIPPVPGLVQAGAATLGVQLRSYIDARAPDARKDQGFAPGTRPGEGEETLFDNIFPGKVEDALRGLGASFGGAMFDFFKGMRADMNPRAEDFGNEKKTFSEALGNRFQEYKQKVADSTAELGSGPLFDTFRGITPSQEAASSLLKSKLDNIKEINDQFTDTTTKHAPRDALGNKKIGLQQYLGAHPAQPGTEEFAIAESINELYKQLAPALAQTKVDYQQRASLQNSNLFGANMKRAMREEISYGIIDRNRLMLEDIQRMERVLSQTYGRKIEFGNFKLQGAQQP